MAPNSQNPRIPSRPATAPAAGHGSTPSEMEERRRTLSDVSRREATHRARIQAQAEFVRPDLRQELVEPEDRELESLANEFMNNDGNDGPQNTRYLTIIPCPHIPGHSHNNIPCMAIKIGCSAAGLNALKPDALLTQLNANTESNASSPASSNTNQVRVE